MSPKNLKRNNDRIRNHTKNSKAKVGLFRGKHGEQSLRVKGVFNF